MNPKAPFPQADVPREPTLRWYLCHGCGWEHRVDGAYHVSACGNPECQEPCLHIHNNSDGELPRTLDVPCDNR